ncbi:hypothetical protein PIB30_039379 [Stylosanthes scabra]|uniref:Uncharacterized protein n=1 Tax=Stylosanthes scabra TaxID=79078 RepID=A0ABU6XDG9_9FABA|nr:hypothetical protein [Stylosanthes scabra]
MDIEQVLQMNHGMGDNSYANNSTIQCLKVADLGCSSGPNALEAVSNVINIVDSITRNLNLKPPVFQFFLNDLFRNDFNTIFKLLPQFLETLEENKGANFGPCFINATSGTFYKRLFPDNSLHLVHSSFSLHWLSQAPKELVNKENIYLTSTSPPAMQKAYLEQFQQDFKQFLRLRSQELVSKGRMVLNLFGRDQIRDRRTCWRLYGITLDEMVLENLIEEKKLESFNLPMYGPTTEEVKEVIEEEGSFTLQRLESVIVDYDEGLGVNEDNKVDINMRAEVFTKLQRAGLEPLFKAQFGEHVMDELFLRFKNKIVQSVEAKILLEFPTLIISLVKNA